MSFDLLIHRLNITARAKQSLQDPFLFSHLRTLYQEALAKVSPCKGSSRCADQFACPFHTAFAQELSSDLELVRRHQKPPHPFAWHVPLLTQKPALDELTLWLVLVGRAAAHIASHVLALGQLFTHPLLKDVELTGITVAGTGEEAIPWRINSLTVPPELPTLSWDDLLIQAGSPVTKQIITLETPLRLLAAGRPMVGFDASLFLRHVVRRCSAMADYYGDSVMKVDFRALAAASSEIAAIDMQLRQVKLGGGFQGVCGQVELAGDLVDFWPWLQLGQLLNVGKGAAFGAGQFRLG